MHESPTSQHSPEKPNSIQITHKALSVFLLHVTHATPSQRQNINSHQCNIRSIVKILPFPPPNYRVWFQKLKRRNEFCLPFHRKLFSDSWPEVVRMLKIFSVGSFPSWVWYTGQCWDILLGLHEIGLSKRDIPGTFYLPWKWPIFYHRSRHSPVVVSITVRNGHLVR